MNIRNLLPKQQTTQGYIVCNSIKFVAISFLLLFWPLFLNILDEKFNSRTSVQFCSSTIILLYYLGYFLFLFGCCCIILDSMKEEEKTRRNIKFFCCIKYIYLYTNIYILIQTSTSKPQILIQTDSPSKCFDQQNGRKTVKKGWGGLFTIHIQMLLVLANTKANN